MSQAALDFATPLRTKAFKPGSQCFSILEHLRAGNTLTPLQCFEKFGVLATHSRMSEIRDAGWNISCVLVTTGTGKQVGCYSLRTR